MNKMTLANLNETQYTAQLSNGLTLIIHPKRGYHSNYALFATRYGSNDNEFCDIEGQHQKVPAGIAHFLEHKMFDEQDGNIFAEFSAMGVSVNAYTSNDMTAYMAYGTRNFKKGLIRLVDFVQNPYFTAESVAKEQGIIAQEIKMYDDHPEWLLQRNLLEGMYHQHPVRIDIAGTVDTISEITAEMLYTCYNTFYHPSNMVLYIVGDFDVEEIRILIEENQKQKTFLPARPIERFYPSEPAAIHQSDKVDHMSVAIPLLALGIKNDLGGKTGRELLKYEILNVVVCTALLDQSSVLYNKLYEQGLVTEDFDIHYEGATTYAYIYMGGPTPDPQALKEELRQGIALVQQEGISLADLQRIKRKFKGLYSLSFDSQATIANRYVTFFFKGIDFNDYPIILDEITLEDVNNCLRTCFDWSRVAKVIIQAED